MKEKCAAYLLGEQTELTSLFSGLPGKYSVHAGNVSVATLCYEDTFDWRFYEKGLICLRQSNGVHVLVDFRDGARIHDWSVLETPSAPDCVAGAVDEKLRLVAGIRTLLVQAEVTRQSQSFQIVNRDRKTVLSGVLELNQLLLPEGKTTYLGSSLRIERVRGYDKILARVAALLKNRGLEPGCPEERTLRLALAVKGRRPLEYSSQFSIILDPADSVVQAAQKIFLQLLGTMDVNIPGIIKDIDPEFLHDFRVALRRTRSLLGTMKKKVPPGDAARFQQGFKKIGAATGPVRDLDVYLLGKNRYQAMLPEGLQEGLAVFFTELARQRVKELQRMKKALQAREMKEFLMQWRSYVEDSLPASAFEAGHEPCHEVAVKAIRKRLRSLLKDGAAIGPQSPDAALHRVRIQAKKLRYLLEFYRSLFPEPEMNFLVKSLKKLQDNLGSFNDLSVQQAMLDEYQKGLAVGEQKKGVKVAAALGGLITQLYREQTGVRQKFEQTFEQFATVEHRKLFDLLF